VTIILYETEDCTIVFRAVSYLPDSTGGGCHTVQMAGSKILLLLGSYAGMVLKTQLQYKLRAEAYGYVFLFVHLGSLTTAENISYRLSTWFCFFDKQYTLDSWPKLYDFSAYL
jgi:hypothetical protein